MATGTKLDEEKKKEDITKREEKKNKKINEKIVRIKPLKA